MKFTVYLCHNLQDKRTTQLWLQNHMHVVCVHAYTYCCMCMCIQTQARTLKQIKLHLRCTGEKKKVLFLEVGEWVKPKQKTVK